MVAALVLPFYEPVRLAEDMAVLDIISRGRVAYVLGIGHRAEEYEHFGVERAGRGQRIDEQLTALLELLGAAETARRVPWSRRRRRAAVRSSSSVAAASRGPAGRSVRSRPDRAGGDARPGRGLRAGVPRRGPRARVPAGPGSRTRSTAMFVADDVDRAWDELGRHLLHDAMTAASYRPRRDGGRQHQHHDHRRRAPHRRPTGSSPSTKPSTSSAAGTILPLLPLCGGLAPDVAWPYLSRAADAVDRAAT